MKSTIQNKNKIVNSVFSTVHEKYDVMNDIMSLGAHRFWKEKLIEWMNPRNGLSLIDVASGTGDIAKLFSKKLNSPSVITCVEPNLKMLKRGKIKLQSFKNINWINAYAEKLPVKSNVYDFYSISYGIRNVADINKCLREAYRVLKPGGRFMCLEFSKIDNEIIDYFYKKYSKTIPLIGKYIVGSREPYDYLVNSIKKFYNQNQLVDLIKKNGFSDVEYRNLSNGISAIHSGWKI